MQSKLKKETKKQWSITNDKCISILLNYLKNTKIYKESVLDTKCVSFSVHLLFAIFFSLFKINAMKCVRVNVWLYKKTGIIQVLPLTTSLLMKIQLYIMHSAMNCQNLFFCHRIFQNNWYCSLLYISI
jgi:hypothetical protein